QESPGIESATMAMTLIRLNSQKLPLPPRSVVVVDECGQLGTAPLARLQEHVAKAGARLIYGGDSRQLQPILGGAPFDEMTRGLDAATLRTIKRQNEKWHQDLG